MQPDQANLFEAYFADRSNIKIRNKIIEVNLNLVKSRSAKWARENPRYREEFIQVGTIAMIQSLERFKPNGCKFSTYAVYAIDTAIKRFLHDYGYSPIRRPTRHYDIIHAESAIIARYQSKHGRLPSKSELFQELKKKNKNFTVAQYYLAKESQKLSGTYSLDYQYPEDDGLSILDRIAIQNYAPDDEQDPRLNLIFKQLKQLPQCERLSIISWIAGMTDDQVGASLDRSPTTIKNYRAKGLKKLRESLL